MDRQVVRARVRGHTLRGQRRQNLPLPGEAETDKQRQRKKEKG
jgi:hypothetical protein